MKEFYGLLSKVFAIAAVIVYLSAVTIETHSANANRPIAVLFALSIVCALRQIILILEKK